MEAAEIPAPPSAPPGLSPSAQKVQDALRALGFAYEVRESAQATRTAAEAAPAVVREHAGYAVGGIPPLGHAKPMETFIDEDLLRHEAIWAAAGTPNALFRMASADLVTMTGGRVIKVKS